MPMPTPTTESMIAFAGSPKTKDEKPMSTCMILPISNENELHSFDPCKTRTS